jgi:DNA (cytosine-5)-methyltransferase 3A
LIGGSPCQGFSLSGKRKGMSTSEGIDITTLEQYLELKKEGFEFDGQSYLFWEYVRVLHLTKPKYFLLENINVLTKWKSVFNSTLGVKPVLINSILVSAQNRNRYYWCGKRQDGGTYRQVYIPQPKDKGILLKDILINDDIDYATWNKASIIRRRLDANGIRRDDDSDIPYTQCLEVRNTDNEKMGCLTTFSKDNVLTPLGVGRHIDVYKRKLKYRKLHPVECERLQTVNDGYTESVSESQRYKMLGNGFTIDVIVHLIKNMLSENVKYVDNLEEW